MRKVQYWDVEKNEQGKMDRVIKESVVVGTNNSERAPGIYIPGGKCVDLRDVINIQENNQ